MTSATIRSLRRAASSAKRRLFPAPELAAWRHACRQAAVTRRYTAGEIALNGYRIAYSDLLTLCPQWHDIFVTGSLRFEAPVSNPRILDCGANVGLASLYFKRLYPGARITAFEADPTLAALCRRNLAANGAADVQVEASAVWRETGHVTFRQEGADQGAIDEAGSPSAHILRVPSVRLRDILTRERVDLLKLDIEGAEGAVLADCSGTLDRVGAVVMDLHEFDPRRRQTPQVMGLLADAGFLVSVSEVVPIPWQVPRGTASPFPGDSATWCTTLRAWRA